MMMPRPKSRPRQYTFKAPGALSGGLWVQGAQPLDEIKDLIGSLTTGDEATVDEPAAPELAPPVLQEEQPVQTGEGGGALEQAQLMVAEYHIRGFAANPYLNGTYTLNQQFLVNGRQTYWSQDGEYFMYEQVPEGRWALCPRSDPISHEDLLLSAMGGDTPSYAFMVEQTAWREFNHRDGSWQIVELQVGCCMSDGRVELLGGNPEDPGFAGFAAGQNASMQESAAQQAKFLHGPPHIVKKVMAQARVAEPLQYDTPLFQGTTWNAATTWKGNTTNAPVAQSSTKNLAELKSKGSSDTKAGPPKNRQFEMEEAEKVGKIVKEVEASKYDVQDEEGGIAGTAHEGADEIDNIISELEVASGIKPAEPSKASTSSKKKRSREHGEEKVPKTEKKRKK